MQRKKLSIEVPDAPLRMHSDTLADVIRAGSEPGLVILDVRGDDFKGGHVKGAINIPYEELQQNLAGVAEKYKAAEKIVIYCMQSQVRGPACAAALKIKLHEIGSSAEVYILIGGFASWARSFPVPELIEDYDEGLWNQIWEASGGCV